MNIVYVVVRKDWDDFDVVGTFSTFEKANQFIGSMEQMEDRVNSTIYPQEVK
jgi:hypothetical protein